MSEANEIFRGAIPKSLSKKTKLVAGLREIAIGDVLTQALIAWLKRPENQVVIQNHNLE